MRAIVRRAMHMYAPNAILQSTRARSVAHWAGWLVRLLALQQPHVGGLGALRPLRDVELDDLPLSKRAVASRLDRAEMHEDIHAGLSGDEAVALLGVEPLHGSNRQGLVPPSMVLEVSTNAGPDRAAAARDKLDLRVAKQKT